MCRREPLLLGDLIYILDVQVKKLMNKVVASIKVLRKNHLVEGATQEAEVYMKSCYSHLIDEK